MYKRIVFYGVTIAIIIWLVAVLLRPAVVESRSIVVLNSDDRITCEHIFHSLKAKGIRSMALGSLNHDGVHFRVSKSQFGNAIEIVESSAVNSSTIRILGYDERGNLWVDRGSGTEFSAELDEPIHQDKSIPQRFEDLLVAINHEFPDSEMANDELTITRFHVSERRCLGSSGILQTGFDVTLDALYSDQTTVSNTYQITDAMTDVRRISDTGTE